MRSYLKQPLIDCVTEVEISYQDFLKLQEARHALKEAYSLEEKYDIVISNFLDFETAVITHALNSSLRYIRTYDEFSEVITKFNTKLINFLAAASLFIEQLPFELKDKIRVEYDNCFEYRFMQALRNHSVHSHLSVVLKPQKVKPCEHIGGHSETAIQLIIKKSALKQNKKFKAQIINEMPEEVNLIQFTRRYVESISQLNEDNRGLQSDLIKSSRELIESKHSLYSDYYRLHKSSDLSAYHCDDNNEISEVYLSLKWDDVRENLVKKNFALKNLSKKYVSNRNIS